MKYIGIFAIIGGIFLSGPVFAVSQTPDLDALGYAQSHGLEYEPESSPAPGLPHGCSIWVPADIYRSLSGPGSLHVLALKMHICRKKQGACDYIIARSLLAAPPTYEVAYWEC